MQLNIDFNTKLLNFKERTKKQDQFENKTTRLCCAFCSICNKNKRHMKKIIFTIVYLVVLTGVNAQVLDEKNEPKRSDDEIKTIFSGSKSNGGYFDLYVNYTEVDSREAIEIGSRIAFIIGHSLSIGIDGAGFISNIEEESPGKENLITGGYGGLVIEPIIFPKAPVHITTPILMGGGAAVYAVTNDRYPDEMMSDNVDPFLLVRPGLEIEFNITRYLRFSLGASYRITTNMGNTDERFLSSKGMNGLSGGISFKLGKF